MSFFGNSIDLDDGYDGDFIDLDDWQPSLVADKPLYSLPELTSDEVWYCHQCGANCKPKFYKHVYQRIICIETNKGTENFEQFYVSPCCLGNLGIYFKSTEKDREIPAIHFTDPTNKDDAE